MQKTIVVGAGHWHLPLYRDAFLEHHEIVGVWDIDPGDRLVPSSAAVPRRRHHRGLRPADPRNRRRRHGHRRDRLDLPGGPGQGVNYTAVGNGGPVAVDTLGGVELNAPGRDTAHQTVDVDSDALYPIFVQAVAANDKAGFAGMPTLSDLVAAMSPIEESYAH